MKNFVRLSLFLLLLFFVALQTIFCNSDKSKVEETTSPYKNLSDSAKYVGINTCKQCHQNIYESFKETGMGKSFDFATHSKTSAKFEHAVIYDKFSDFYYKAFWIGEEMYILEYRLEGKDTVHKRVERINYIIGSGQHTNSHMLIRNGYLFQAPMTFYTQKKEWDLPPGFENGVNSRFSRLIGLECMSCHNSYPKFVMGSENKFTELPNGINCERCHGPGSIHVKEKMSGHVVDINKEIDYSIVNPSKLPVDIQFEICQRCHLQGNTVLNEGKSFYDFKPGMKLSEVMNVFVPKYKEADNEYIMASHVERLRMSRCFSETMKKLETGEIPISDKLRPYKNGMTCVTCHNPHVSVRVTGKETFNNACRNCHNSAEKLFCSRDHKLKTEQIMNGDCISCHMKKAGTIDIPHVVTTDHFIRKPVSVSELKKIKEFIGITCVNNQKVDRKTIAKGYIQYFDKFKPEPLALDSAEKIIIAESKKDLKAVFSTLVYLYYTKNQYKEVIKYAEKLGDKGITTNQHQSWGNEDAWTDFRIGDSYLQAGNYGRALVYLKLAVDLAPYYLDFRSKLGIVYMYLGQKEAAKSTFEMILKENPGHVIALSNLGYVYLAGFNDPGNAEKQYNKALSLDPDYTQGLMNKAGLLLYKRDMTEAKKILKQVLKKNPKNIQARQILNQINQ